MESTAWYLIVGLLFVALALGSTLLRRLPLTAAILYLAVGVAIGPIGTGLIALDPIAQAPLVERVTEVAVIVSLFTAGLKLRVVWRDPLWRLPLRLAFGSMLVTVALVAAAGVVGLGLPIGAAILLGAILAPTDPVLASDVQVDNPGDRDRLRFALTGEAGLNDGAAFPFLFLGLGLMGLREIGDFGWRWLALDLVWAVAGGIGIGALLGTLVGRLVVFLRREHQTALGLDDFLTLGLIALAYGIALLLHVGAFLAVFAAGAALRRIEQQQSGGNFAEAEQAVANLDQEEEAETHPETAPAHMAQEVLGFNERLERIGEAAVVVLIGTFLGPHILSLDALWFVPLLLLVIRPVSVAIGLAGTKTLRTQRRLVAWFGIRGIGSLYYLTYAVEYGVPEELAARLTALTLSVIAVSIVVHGVSVTPLMARYERRVETRRAATA